jgi:hypothetical protein
MGDGVMKHVYSVFGYIVASFATQATSHFLLFKEHYDAVIWMKPDPVFAFGLLSMIIQGTIMSLVFSWLKPRAGLMIDSLAVSWLFGAFLVSYISFGEAAKYAVPSMASWIGVEIFAGAVQFTMAGLLMGLAHGRSVAHRPSNEK